MALTTLEGKTYIGAPGCSGEFVLRSRQSLAFTWVTRRIKDGRTIQ